jgi:hypothetical protein
MGGIGTGMVSVDPDDFENPEDFDDFDPFGEDSDLVKKNGYDFFDNHGFYVSLHAARAVTPWLAVEFGVDGAYSLQQGERNWNGMSNDMHAWMLMGMVGLRFQMPVFWKASASTDEGDEGDSE